MFLRSNAFRSISIFVVATGLALAQHGVGQNGTPPGQGGTPPGLANKGGQNGKAHGKGLGLILKMLDLTDQQAASAKTIFDTADSQAKPLEDQISSASTDLQAAIKTNDTANISALATQIGGLRAQVIATKANAWAQFYALLTPTQQQKVDDLLAFFGLDD
ncbi:MAG: Spy/CpxP family protein refolding chaperone [Acidobacteriota bacterium]